MSLADEIILSAKGAAGAAAPRPPDDVDAVGLADSIISSARRAAAAVNVDYRDSAHLEDPTLYGPANPPTPGDAFQGLQAHAQDLYREADAIGRSGQHGPGFDRLTHFKQRLRQQGIDASYFYREHGSGFVDPDVGAAHYFDYLDRQLNPDATAAGRAPLAAAMPDAAAAGQASDAEGLQAAIDRQGTANVRNRATRRLIDTGGQAGHYNPDYAAADPAYQARRDRPPATPREDVAAQNLDERQAQDVVDQGLRRTAPPGTPILADAAARSLHLIGAAVAGAGSVHRHAEDRGRRYLGQPPAQLNAAERWGQDVAGLGSELQQLHPNESIAGQVAAGAYDLGSKMIAGAAAPGSIPMLFGSDAAAGQYAKDLQLTADLVAQGKLTPAQAQDVSLRNAGIVGAVGALTSHLPGLGADAPGVALQLILKGAGGGTQSAAQAAAGQLSDHFSLGTDIDWGAVAHEALIGAAVNVVLHGVEEGIARGVTPRLQARALEAKFGLTPADRPELTQLLDLARQVQLGRTDVVGARLSERADALMARVLHRTYGPLTTGDPLRGNVKPKGERLAALSGGLTERGDARLRREEGRQQLAREGPPAAGPLDVDPGVRIRGGEAEAPAVQSPDGVRPGERPAGEPGLPEALPDRDAAAAAPGDPVLPAAGQLGPGDGVARGADRRPGEAAEAGRDAGAPGGDAGRGDAPPEPEPVGAAGPRVDAAAGGGGADAGAAPVARRPLPPLDPENDPYERHLAHFADRLYTDAGIRKALAIVDRTTHDDPQHPDGLWMANTPDMAAGQGDNTGYLIELNPQGLRGHLNMHKPAWRPAYEQGHAEFSSVHNAQRQYQEAVQAVTYDPARIKAAMKSAPGFERSLNTRMLNVVLPRLEAEGWTRTENPDGTVTVRRPGTHAPAADAPTTPPPSSAASKPPDFFDPADAGPVGDKAPTPEASPAKPAEPAPAAPAAAEAQRPKKRAGPARPFSRQDLQRQIRRAAGDQGVPDDVDQFLGGLLHPYTFTRDSKYRGELRQYVGGKDGGKEGVAIARSGAVKFTDDPSLAGGEDAIQAFRDRYGGDRGEELYWRTVRENAGIGFQDALARVRKSPDPQHQLMVVIHDNLPEGKRPKQDVRDPKQMAVGTVFELNGERMEIVEDADGFRLLKDGDDYPVLPVDGLDAVPVDRGTLRHEEPAGEIGDPFADLKDPAPAAPAAEASPKPAEFFDADAAGASQQKPGLFGQPVFDGATGNKQGAMFDTTKPAPTSEPIRGSGNALDPKNTAQMFPGEGPPKLGPLGSPAVAEPPPPASTTPAPRAPAPAAPREMKAAPTNPPPGRIQPDPLPGGEAKQLKKIIEDGAAALGAQVRRAKGASGSIGTYYPGSRRTSIKYAGDLNVAAHELGHNLDDLAGVVGHFVTGVSPYDHELIPHFSQYGSKPPAGSGPAASLVYERAEGVAEWFRAWVVNPAAAEKAAPDFTKHFMAVVDPKLVAKMRAFGDDVRRYVGLSEVEKVLSNVRVDEERVTLGQRLRAMVTGKGPLKYNAGDEVIRQFFDDLRPLKKGLRAAGEMRDDLADVMPGYSRADQVMDRVINFAGGNKRFERILEDGPVKFRSDDPDAAFQRAKGVDGGAAWLFGEDLLKGAPAPDVRRAHRDAIALLTSERVTEKAGQVMSDAIARLNARLLPGQTIAGQIAADPKFKKRYDRIMAAARSLAGRVAGIGARMTPDDVQAARAILELRADPARYKLAGALRDRYRAWADANLQYLQDGGRMTAEQVQAIRDGNQFYSDFHRVMEEQGMGAGAAAALGNVRRPIHRMLGSTRQLENPFVNLLEQTAKVVREVDRNAVLREVTTMLTSDRGMYEGNPRNLDAIGSRASAGDEKAIKVYVDGKAQFWQFEQHMHEALTNLGRSQDLGWVLATTSLIAKKLPQWAVTHNPGFVFRQMFKDGLGRAILSEHDLRPWDAFKKQSADTPRNFELAGGAQGGGYMTEPAAYHKFVRDQLKKVAEQPGTLLALPGKAGRLFGKAFEELGDARSRKAEFEKAYEHARKRGMDATDAANYAAARARDLADWATAGAAVRKLSPFIPFLNPAFQGLSRTARGMMRSPGTFAAGMMAYVLLPRLATYAWNARDEKTLEEYRQLPSWRRDLCLNFKVGHLWLSIPNPYELGVLGAGVERAFDAYGGNKHAGEGYAADLARSLSPVDESIIAGPLKPAIELATNHDFFFNRSIIPAYEEGKDLSLRDTSHASRLGQALTHAAGVMGMSVDPRYVDHFAYSMTGGLGWLAQDVSDMGREDRQSTRFLQSGVGLFTPPPAGGSPDVQRVAAESRRLGDEASPQAMGLAAASRQLARAKDAAERDRLAADVRKRAAFLRDFYDRHGDDLMELRQLGLIGRPGVRAAKDERRLGGDGGDEAIGRDKERRTIERDVLRVRRAIEQAYTDGEPAHELEALHAQLHKLATEAAAEIKGLAPAGGTR